MPDQVANSHAQDLPQEWAALDRMSRAALEALQLQRLRAQVASLMASNPWFQRRFAEAGVGVADLRSMADIERFPTMTKADLLADVDQYPPYGSRLGVSNSEIREIVTSGGSSGRSPEPFAFTSDDLRTCVDLYAMDQYWKGARPGDIGMMVTQIGLLASAPLNVRAWERLGMAVLRVGPNSTEDRIATMLRFQPTVLKLPYVYALRFIEACRQAGVEPRKAIPGLKYIFTSGGSYPLEFAQNIEEFFDAPLHEVFGCSQAGGVVAGTCEHGVRTVRGRGLMHTYDHQLVVEVIDPASGEHVRDGEEGELVITPLARRASPVFRYRMGDRVRWFAHGQCPCGRPFSSIESGTVARYDDMMKIKGINVWQHEIDNFILADDRIDEFNGVVAMDSEGRERARIMVELRESTKSNSKPNDVCHELEQSLKKAFRLAIDVEVVPKGTVQRFELKQRRWKDERTARFS